MVFTNKRTLWTSSLAAAGVLCMLGTAGCGMGTGGASESPGSGSASGESSSGSGGSAEKAVGTDSKDSDGSGGSGDTGDSANAEDSGSSEEDSGSDSAGSACVSDDLEAALGSGEGGGAAGTRYMSLMLTNTSGSPCVLNGYPGVSYVTGDSGKQVGASAAREGGGGSAVTLNPGETGYAELGFANVDNFDPGTCQPTEVRGLRVYPPGETDALFVSAPGTGCANADIPGDQLTIGAVQ